MAYNLESLIQILDHIPHPNHTWILDPNKKPEIESLLVKSRFLKDFFENYSPLVGDNIESLESRITDAAYEAKDVLESLIQILDHILHPNHQDTWILDPNKKPEIESLLAKSSFLKDFFENYSLLVGDNIESLASRTMDARFEAEDVLESLIQILDHILHPNHQYTWILDPNKKPEIESLLEKASFLKDFFEKSSPLVGDNIESLESRITDAAQEAEDVLESHLADRILSVRAGEKLRFSPPDGLQKVITELDSAEKEIKKMMNGSRIDSSPAADLSRRSDLNPKNILVGFSKDLIQLKDRVTGQQPKFQTIPIVGMGGSGKTTLARNVYDDPLVISRFDIHAWIVISQDYDLRRSLLGLLHCVTGKVSEKMLKGKNEELGLCLHKSLCGRRYLIILDDMWVLRFGIT